MGSKKKPAPRRSGDASKRKLPAALAKRARQAVEAAKKRRVQRARADIDLIRRRKGDIVEAFYDIGEALVRLKAPGIAATLGYPTFYAMCHAEVGLAATQVDELIDIVRSTSRNDAIGMGQSVAGALARLAEATPDPGDTPVAIYRKGVTSPSGKLVKKGASARAIDRAASEFRHQRPTRRGRTSTPEERALAHRIEAHLHVHGVRSAKVRALATKPGQESNLRIEGIPFSKLGVLAKALSK